MLNEIKTDANVDIEHVCNQFGRYEKLEGMHENAQQCRIELLLDKLSTMLDRKQGKQKPCHKC